MDFRILEADCPLWIPIHQAMDITSDHPSEKSSGVASRAYVRDEEAMAATMSDVKEHLHVFEFVIEMPGLRSGDIKVQIENENLLVVSGERKRDEDKEGVNYLRMERRIGKFMRMFLLPENANLEKISATCKDGVLTVTVHKVPPPEPKQPKTIQVQVG